MRATLVVRIFSLGAVLALKRPEVVRFFRTGFLVYCVKFLRL